MQKLELFMQYSLLIWFLLLSACAKVVDGDGPPHTIPEKAIQLVQAKQEPLSRSGNQASYTVFGKTYYTQAQAVGYQQLGIASWYGQKFHGRKTASGEVYNMFALTAAHKTLPLPTYVKVTNLKNNKYVIVKINDRGPFHSNRIIDLSWAAAKQLDMIKTGTTKIKMVVLATPKIASKKTQAILPKSKSNAKTRQYYLQVGAFKNKNNATKLLKQLQSHYKQAYMMTSLDQQYKIYRVRLGPFQTRRQLKPLIQRLAKLGLEKPHIIQR